MGAEGFPGAEGLRPDGPGPVSGAPAPEPGHCLAGDLREIAAEKEAVSVTVYRSGPYLVRGSFTLVDATQTVLDPGRRTVALCSCGRSRAKPFCDGSHKAGRRWMAPEVSDRNPVGAGGS